MGLADIVRAYPANQLSFWDRSRRLLLALGRVPERRAARGQQRGRRVPGDLRHRGDDAADVARSSCRSACSRRSTCASTRRPAPSSAPCASRSTTWPACRASCSASSASASSATRRRLDRRAVLRGEAPIVAPKGLRATAPRREIVPSASRGRTPPGLRVGAARRALPPPFRPCWSVGWFVDPDLGGARKTVAQRFI